MAKVCHASREVVVRAISGCSETEIASRRVLKMRRSCHFQVVYAKFGDATLVTVTVGDGGV